MEEMQPAEPYKPCAVPGCYNEACAWREITFERTTFSFRVCLRHQGQIDRNELAVGVGPVFHRIGSTYYRKSTST